MHYYKILKHKAGFDEATNDWEKIFARYIAGTDKRVITGFLPLTFESSGGPISWTIYGRGPTTDTETGTLPLTFTTAKGGNAVDWTIYGNAEGVGEQTKNLLAITANTNTIYDVTFTVNLNDGSIVATGKCSSSSTNQAQFNLQGSSRLPISNAPLSNGMLISCENLIAGTRFALVYYDANATYISEQICDRTNSSQIISIPANAVYYRFYIRKTATAGDTTVTFKPMFRKADTTPEFIPYGYQVPLTVSQSGQTDKNYDIFIGDAPLTEGESVSLTSTGIDIELFEGENTVDTTLTNKPDMSITYTDYLGIGEYVDGQWQIPVFVSGGKRYFDWITDSYSHSQYGLTVTGDANHRLHITGAVDNTGSGNNVILKTMTIEMALPVGDYIFRGAPNYEETGFFLGGGLFHATPEWYNDEGNGSRFTKTDYSQTFFTMYLYFDREKVEGIQQDFYITPIVESVKTYDIPIDAPLREGQSITDTIDIEAFKGENTIDTTLDVKPGARVIYEL